MRQFDSYFEENGFRYKRRCVCCGYLYSRGSIEIHYMPKRWIRAIDISKRRGCSTPYCGNGRKINGYLRQAGINKFIDSLPK